MFNIPRKGQNLGYVKSSNKFQKFFMSALFKKRVIKPVHSKGDQSRMFFGRNDAQAETPILWPPHVKSWLIGKDSDAGRDWGQEEKGTTEDEMAGWHHRLNGHEFEWTPGLGNGQRGLACCDSWGRKESDTTDRLNWTELNWKHKGLPYILENQGVSPWNNFFLSWIFLIFDRVDLYTEFPMEDIRIKK